MINVAFLFILLIGAIALGFFLLRVGGERKGSRVVRMIRLGAGGLLLLWLFGATWVVQSERTDADQKLTFDLPQSNVEELVARLKADPDSSPEVDVTFHYFIVEQLGAQWVLTTNVVQRVSLPQQQNLLQSLVVDLEEVTYTFERLVREVGYHDRWGRSLGDDPDPASLSIHLSGHSETEYRAVGRMGSSGSGLGDPYSLDKVKSAHDIGGANAKPELRIRRAGSQVVYEYITLSAPGAEVKSVDAAAWLSERIDVPADDREPFRSLRPHSFFEYAMSRVPIGFFGLILGAWLVSPGCVFVPRLRFPLVLLLSLLAWVGMDRALLERDIAAFEASAPGTVQHASAFERMSRSMFFRDTAIAAAEAVTLPSGSE